MASTGFLWNEAYDPVNGGMWYGYGFTNCLNLQGALWPAYGCSGGYLAQNQDYAVETGNAFARQYLMSRAAADQRTGGYPSTMPPTPRRGLRFLLGFGANPNYADLLNCCDAFTLTKYYGQVFALGQAATWPAARLGGVQPRHSSEPVDQLQSWPGVPGAVSRRARYGHRSLPVRADVVFDCAVLALPGRGRCKRQGDSLVSDLVFGQRQQCSGEIHAGSSVIAVALRSASPAVPPLGVRMRPGARKVKSGFVGLQIR
jgi:hypothetical protein